MLQKDVHTDADTTKKVLFVLSDVEPDEVKYLDAYTYKVSEFDNTIGIFRLCEVTYILENSIRYTVLDWKLVKPKSSQDESLFKVLIDANKALSEHLLTPSPWLETREYLAHPTDLSKTVV